MGQKQKQKKQPRRVIIRLYRQFDIDLIYLFSKLKENNINIQEFVKSVIRGYMSSGYAGRQFEGAKKIKSILREEKDGQTITLRRKIQYHVLLVPDEDEDLFEWLETITIGYRNTVIKELIRSYINVPCIYPCLSTTKIRFVGKDASCLSGDEGEESNLGRGFGIEAEGD